jgi:group II intron reverse transcriptase/maturase
MDDRGKSDGPVVPEKPSNNAHGGAAEMVEERGPAKGNAASETRPGLRAGLSVSSELDRVRRAARKDKEARFTALLHHVDVDRLRAAYRAIRPGAAPGVDGVTWLGYGQDLESNLTDLHARVHRGGYRARPSRRVFIPKADGRQRPLGVAALEDKILQRALVEVLNAIYEADFLGFSYGFRPGRTPHDALDALAAAIKTRRVNWVLDADLREFFTSLDHRWLAKFLEHRIADERVLRLIRKWLAAGVIENGAWTASEEGVPQGASVSPLLANVYLHYGKRRDKTGMGKGMRTPDAEGVATHGGPESCVGDPRGRSEALAGVRAGWVIEPRNRLVRGADALVVSGRQHRRGRYRESSLDPARSKSLGMYGVSMRENREVP